MPLRGLGDTLTLVDVKGVWLAVFKAGVQHGGSIGVVTDVGAVTL